MSIFLTGGILPYPHLHGIGWHCFIALASALLIIAATTERLTVVLSSQGPGGSMRGDRVWLEPNKHFGFFFPVLRRDSLKSTHATK